MQSSGFIGIGYFCACYKCKCQFASISNNHLKRDFSRFKHDDIQRWIGRTKEGNLASAKAWRNAGSYEERERLEQTHGARWSELHRLEYFDPVRCTVIDLMHNL